MYVILFAIGTFILTLAIDFALISGVYWVVCWAFSVIFSWKIAIALTLVFFIIHGLFKTGD